MQEIRRRRLDGGSRRARCLRLLGLVATLAAVDAPAADIRDPGQGLVDLLPGATGAAELSGITHAGGNRFYAVSDNGGRLFPLRIEIDPASGRITAALPDPPRKLAGGIDLEGIALLADDRVVVCDEIGPALREHRLADGGLIRSLPVPVIFRRSRNNLGLESLSAGGDGLWIANEEALRVDGPPPTAEAGSRVRLQHLDLAGTPTGQWAYVTDPYPGAPLFGRAHSGVSDLLALPGGELLVLERAFSSHGFRSRIYQVDFASATQTGSIERLEAAAVTPVAKRLLWDSGAFSANFEGLTLGPRLAAGDRSLLLVADESGAGVPGLYPLRIDLGEATPKGTASPVDAQATGSERPGP
jgi:hypothetical protein